MIGRAAWEICSNQSEELSSDASSVWNFCFRSSDVISRENQWWRRLMSAVFLTLPYDEKKKGKEIQL